MANSSEEEDVPTATARGHRRDSSEEEAAPVEVGGDEQQCKQADTFARLETAVGTSVIVYVTPPSLADHTRRAVAVFFILTSKTTRASRLRRMAEPRLGRWCAARASSRTGFVGRAASTAEQHLVGEADDEVNKVPKTDTRH